MNDSTDGLMDRSFRARVGVTALNLIAPGLGLARIGHWRGAALFLLVPFGFALLAAFALGHLPIIGFFSAVSVLVVAFALPATLYLVPAVLTWRQSRIRVPARGWSRWYGMTLIAACMLAAWQLAAPLVHSFYKPFYAPAASMAPTIDKGDKFIVDMKWRGPVKRGDVLVLRAPDSVRVSRVVALGGDKIGMRAGVPIINGTLLIQKPISTVAQNDDDGLHQAAVLTERLPGERSAHRVIDAGISEFDDMPETIVPFGHFFVLGDNRDRSADSRVPVTEMGVGMVPIAAIIGRAMYIYWSGDRAKIGARLDR